MRALKNVPIEATERAWMEVNLGALRKNCRTLSERLADGCRLLPMVKADAYGVGLSGAMRALADCSPWGFGVATTEEGRRVRGLGWEGPVVVFAPSLPGDLPGLGEERLEPAVAGLEALLACAENDAPDLAVHLEVDTGMGRLGLDWQTAEDWAPRVADVLSRSRVRLAGTLTHFHSADVAPPTANEQWVRFDAALQALRRAGVDPGLVHAENSAGAMLGERFGDLARPGIYLYGGGTWEPRARPVASVRARVMAVRDVAAGATVSYGATWTAPRPARLATLAIGYGDGLRRELSNRGRAIIGGRTAPVRGVVCMDMTVVDVSGRDDVRPGDVATLLGRDGEEEIGLEELARLCDTIDYEILTGWSRRLPRLEREGHGTEVDDGLMSEAPGKMRDGT
jgi:alanine racemase